MLKIIRILFKCLSILLLFLVFIASLQYLVSKWYIFPEPKPFSGKHWFNPYETLNGEWYKSNFHAHSKTWLSLTNGAQTGDSVIAKYNALGYDVIGISDYHSINTWQNFDDPMFIPVYEHGYNIKKSHRLAIGSRKVSFFDFPLIHTLHQKQYLIERLKRNSPVVAIAHPEFFGGHNTEDFKYLSGYDCIEVLNHYRISDKHWDSALSAGKIAWIIANDDSHNVSKKGETGVMWTMIHAEKAIARSILENLSSGKAYGVWGSEGLNDNYIKKIKIDKDTLSILLGKEAKKITLIGQNGAEKAIFHQSDSIFYPLKVQDTYIRTVVENEKSSMYLNPVFRYDGVSIPKNQFTCQVNRSKTWLIRSGILFIYFFVLAWFLKKIIKKKIT